MREYVIYTDGSAIGKSPNFYGGWAVIVGVLVNGEPRVIDAFSDGKFPSTNNEMELTAVLEAIKYANKIFKEEENSTVTIYSDSQYTIKSITEWMPNWAVSGWTNSKGKPVANRELMQEIYSLTRFPKGVIKYKHVRGHAGNLLNEMADDWATDASAKMYEKEEGGEQ